MIDLENVKKAIAGWFLEETTANYFTDKNMGDFVIVIKALEDAKEIMEVLKNGSFGTYTAPKDWLERYFEEKLGNNGELIKNPNSEVCEDQVELERLKND